MSREIALTQGKVALVDDEDYERVAELSWYAGKTQNKWYAMRQHRRADGSYYTLYLHRFIMGHPDLHVDHKDGNTFDCRRGNLRLATRSQNRTNAKMRTDNTTGYRGVFWEKDREKWTAKIAVNGSIQRRIGSFDTAEEAAVAYDAEAKKLHGEFARLNFAKQE